MADRIFQPSSLNKMLGKNPLLSSRPPTSTTTNQVSRPTDPDVFTFDDLDSPINGAPLKQTSSQQFDDLKTPRYSEQSSPKGLGDSGRLTPKSFAVPASDLASAIAQSLSVSDEKLNRIIDSRPNAFAAPVSSSVTISAPQLVPSSNLAQSLSSNSMASTCSPSLDASHDGIDIVFKEKKKKKKIIKPETFEDRYELTGLQLGTGAASVVQECRGKSDDVRYAVKTLLKSNYMVAQNREQIFREVDVLKMCEGHANILQLMSFYETPNEFFFVFEKLEGGDLFSHINRKKVFTEQEASLVIRDVTVALAFLHENGIAHRDLKPENVLCVYLDRPSPAKLCDFNLVSKPIKEGELVQMRAVGTPDYMAPEVAAAMTSGQAKAYDKRCDIWSLGVMLYMLLCGYPPFSGDCGANCGWKQGKNCEDCADMLLENIQEGEFDFADQDWKSVSGAAKELIARMLVREDKRATAKDILRHPWIKQLPPPTPLLISSKLQQEGYAGGLSSFASRANDSNRSTTQPLTATMDGARERMGWQPESMRNVENFDLSDIKTPKFR